AVLVSSCAALTEIVSDGYNGVVFEKGNVDSFANKLRELIEDPELRQKLSRNGYEWVVKNRDWTYSAGIIDNVYQELLAEQ
ncbi:glycosyltransferase, partial [Vibrio parahaemolyticus]